MDEEEERTAYHEAGHVVMALACGGTIVHASLERPDDDGPDRHGELITRWPNHDPSELAVRDLQVSLGGPVAEMIYDDHVRPIDQVPEWQADSTRALILARSLSTNPTDADRLRRTVEQDVRQWLSQEHSWAAVCATADLLLAQQTIEHDQCVEAVGFWLRRGEGL